MSSKFSVREHVDSTFKEHVFVPAPSQSFSFFGHTRELRYVPQKTTESLRVSRSSAYSFEITWRPGHILLTGDLGELTLVQKFAMPSFKEALEWVVKADYDYLMGKTCVKKEYDPEATYEYLIQTANREAVDHLLGHSDWSSKEKRYIRRDGVRSDIRRYRKECEEAAVEFEAALAEYTAGGMDGDQPTLDDFLPSREEFGAVLRSSAWERTSMSRDDFRDVRRTVARAWDICGYDTWVSFWVALNANGYYDPAANVDDPDEHPTFVLNPRSRRKLKDEIKSLCDQQHEIVEFLHDAGFDDYYGSYIYPGRSKWQIDAVKHGCKMLLHKVIADEELAAKAVEAA
jgi:hypothetical protein